MRGFRKDFVRGDGIVGVSLRSLEGGRFAVQVGDELIEIEAALLPDGRLRCSTGDATFEADCARAGKALQVRMHGRTWRLEPSRGRRGPGEAGDGSVEAPMTGTVLDVLVEEGQQVEAGQTLVILTAMKMEHKLTAGIAGKVTALRAVVGDNVDQGALLVRVEP